MQYDEFGCIKLLIDIIMPIISHFLYKHNDIVSVEGSSIVMYIACFGSMFI